MTKILYIDNIKIKSVPKITWSPWKPVAKKKVDPYTESDIIYNLK